MNRIVRSGLFLRQQFGLDQPVYVQRTLSQGIARLDLGYSYRERLPVFDLIIDRLPATLSLMVCAFIFARSVSACCSRSSPLGPATQARRRGSTARS